MSTFLQRSAAWIESTFLYASTVFDPDSINVEYGEGVADSTGKAHNNDNSDNVKEEEEEAPQTEDTIPSGLVSSQRYNNDNNSINGRLNAGTQQRRRRRSTPIPPPSRRGKFVQVLHSGGNLDCYTNTVNTTINNNDSLSAASSATQQSLPPHIVISDGEYCCIAFLSPETCVAYSNEQRIKNGQLSCPYQLPSKRSIIGISQYTVSTILQCCRSHTTRQEYHDIMSPPPAAAAALTHNNNSNSTTARRESSSSSINESRSRDSDITVPLPIDLQTEMNSTIQRQYEADMHYQIMSQLLFTDIIPIHYYDTGPYNSDYLAAAAISANLRARRTYQLIPPEIQQQLCTQIPNIQLYLCLYIQGSITFVGAENGGLIGDPIDVHCSVTLRRGLMHHLHLYGPRRNNILGNDEGYSHSMLIQRLEACHNYYYLLDHNNNGSNDNVQQQLIRGGGDGVQDESDDKNTNDEHVVVRNKRKTKKKKYGKGNTIRVVLGGRERCRGGNNNDRDNGSSSGSISSTMKWPWKSCLTITQDIPIVPLPSSSPPIDEIVGIGIRNDDRSNNPITAIGGGREAESINVQIIMQNNNTTPPSPVFGVRGKSIATGHGNVTELFDSTQDIFDILGLEEDYDPIDPVTTDPVNNNNASVEKNNDKNDTNEIDSCDEDSGPTFVGIDDMIIDDYDDDEEEMANTTAGHQEVNFGNDDGMTQDYLLTQPPDAISRRGNDNEDAVSLSSLLDDNDEETTSPPSLRHTRPMPRRNLPRTSSPLPSRPVRSTTRNKKVVVNQQQAVEKEDVPIDTNHTEQQQQQQERPKRGRRKPRDIIQIPIHLRKAPPETLGLPSASALSLAWSEQGNNPWSEEEEVNDDDDEEEGVYIQESQIPMPLMRNRKRDDNDDEEEEEDTVHYESQIPLMTKKSKLTNIELIGHVDQQHEQYNVIESQLPLPQRPSRATLPSSQKNGNDNDDDDSEDSQDLMRVRRIKTKADESMKVSKGKSVSSAAPAANYSDESTTSDLFVESQIAGEGSDETCSPPSPMPSVSKSPLKKKLTSTSTAAAATTNQDTNQDNNDHHNRVRFAIDQTTTTIDNRDVSLRILNKIDRILGFDKGPVSMVKSQERKRKASEIIDIAKFMDKVKRLCGE